MADDIGIDLREAARMMTKADHPWGPLTFEREEGVVYAYEDGVLRFFMGEDVFDRLAENDG